MSKLRQGRAILCRDRLLDAAASLVPRRGAGELTLDAVAERAGVSKGGLLYHFPSKDALIKAMITRMVDGFNFELHAQIAKEPAGPGRITRAIIKVGFDHPKGLLQKDERLRRALLAAVSSKPALLEPVRANVRRWIAALDGDGLPKGYSLLALAVMDGVCFWKMFQMHTPSAEDITSLKKILNDLASVGKAGGPRAGGAHGARRPRKAPAAIR
jgi:AcrR family transcriptional regulator